MKQTVQSLQKKAVAGEKITWLTCYDYSFASALAQTDLDMILVGDSGGMVMLGYSSTVPVTMDEMIHLSKSVRKGAPEKFIVGDMPKGSYEISNEVAVANAMRFVKEAECDAIKLEGSALMSERVAAIVESGISVIGHIGLTPQSSTTFGGYRVVGKKDSEVSKLMNDAKMLESAGAFGILLEAVPEDVGQQLTNNGNVLYFGIGAGQKVHGQLLILHDILGLYPNFRPKFAKNYLIQVIEEFQGSLQKIENLTEYGRKTRQDGIHTLTKMAVNKFILEVKNLNFPTEIHNY